VRVGDVDEETIEDWRNYSLLQETEACDLCDIRVCMYVMLMKLLYFAIYNLAKLSLFEEIFAMVVQNLKSRLLYTSCAISCNISDILPPLVIGKCKISCCFKNVKRLHLYEANRNPWMTTEIFEDYLYLKFVKYCHVILVSIWIGQY
jgi:hypothetical protein